MLENITSICFLLSLESPIFRKKSETLKHYVSLFCFVYCDAEFVGADSVSLFWFCLL